MSALPKKLRKDERFVVWGLAQIWTKSPDDSARYWNAHMTYRRAQDSCMVGRDVERCGYLTEMGTRYGRLLRAQAERAS